jgi:hypothetical protein
MGFVIWCALAISVIHQGRAEAAEHTLQVLPSTAVLAPSASAFTAVAFGSGTFVAVASHGPDGAIVSTDAKTWSTAGLEADEWRDVAFGAGRFVAVAGHVYSIEDGVPRGDSGSTLNGQIASSSTGMEWQRAEIASHPWRYALYCSLSGSPERSSPGGTFLAFSSDGKVALSSDGVNWSIKRVAGVFTFSSRPACGNDKLVSVDTNGDVKHSADGVDWKSVGSLGWGPWSDVVFGAGKFVTFAVNGQVRFSEDGSSWGGNSTDGFFARPLSAGTAFFALDFQGVLSSLDGSSWSRATSLVDDPAASSMTRVWWLPGDIARPTAMAAGNGTVVVVSSRFRSLSDQVSATRPVIWQIRTCSRLSGLRAEQRGMDAVFTWDGCDFNDDGSVAPYTLETGNRTGQTDLGKATITGGSNRHNVTVPRTQPGTYYLRLRGPHSVSEEIKFVMKPTIPTVVSIDDATITGIGAVRLTAMIDAGPLATSVQFAWSESADFRSGSVLPVEGTFSNTATAFRLLTGLKNETTYYFKVQAKNLAGTAEGEVKSFTTPAVEKRKDEPDKNVGPVVGQTTGSSAPSGFVIFVPPTTVSVGESISASDGGIGAGALGLPADAPGQSASDPADAGGGSESM